HAVPCARPLPRRARALGHRGRGRGGAGGLMRGTSQSSLDAVTATFEPVLRAAGAEAATLGEQLFTVVDALDASSSLRRALSDPARDGEAKAGLVAHAP